MAKVERIGVIGYGYVGKAMVEFFKRHYAVEISDPVLGAASATRATINACDLAVVCVPTPMRDGGSCDTSIVEGVFEWLETDLVLLKSTVPPGTTDRLAAGFKGSIVFSPEYCGESSYWSPYAFDRDIKETPFFIFGGERPATSAMVDVFLRVTGPCKTYRQTDARTAEVAKYMANTYFATKVAYCYEMATACAKLGIDWNEARELWLLDPRVGPMHTAVFAENAKPFGGKCLPKDLGALIAASEQAGYTPELLLEVQRTNERLGNLRRG